MPSRVTSLLALLLIAPSAGKLHAQQPFDIVIRGGRVVDGSGGASYVADVAIRDAKIAKIGRIDTATAKRTIDAAGLVVAPGFIDMMGQSASPMLQNPAAAMNLLTQGITTINAGEGASAAPISEEEARHAGWRKMADYFRRIDDSGVPLNVAQTVGHTQVRRLVLGDVDRRASPQELQQMEQLVEEAMRAGAIGVSTALIYPPAVYATTDEIAALAKVAGRHGGRYYTHMRNEGDQLLEAIDEALEIGRLGNCGVHIFHLKAAGRQNWDKMPLAIAKIKAARAAGQHVTADIYPYINNGLSISALIHPRHFAAGQQDFYARAALPELQATIRKEMETTAGWENWYRHVGYDWNKIVIGSTGSPRYAALAGHSVAEMAKANQEDPWVTFFNLVIGKSFALPESMSEENKAQALREPFMSFCTDVGPLGRTPDAGHPRAFGSFPRLLSKYVREQGVISLEQAVAQASAAAASAIMANDRGRLVEGLAADVVIFDYDQIADRATFAKPTEPSVGVRHVIVNGKLVLDNGQLTDARPGRILRGPAYQAVP